MNRRILLVLFCFMAYFGRIYACQTNQAPVAVIDADKNAACIGENVQLYGDGSYDPDTGDTIDEYEWTHPGTSYWSITLPASPENPICQYDSPGTYKVTLRVKDNHGAWSHNPGDGVSLWITVKLDHCYVAPAPTGDDSNGGTAWGDAFATIQKGINSVCEGGTVEVAVGEYEEVINFLGKNITLTSTNPDDPSVVSGTIIQGVGGNSTVTFKGTEGTGGAACLLTGFTIKDDAHLDISDGLISHWNLDDDSGTTADDIVGGYDGELFDDPTWTSTGYIGGALIFDGDGDRVEVPFNSVFNTGSELTVSHWFKTSTNQYSRGMVVHDASTYRYLTYITGAPEVTNGSNNLSFYIRQMVQGSLEVTIAGTGNMGSGFWADDQWHHIVGTFDRSLLEKRLKIYVDGVLMGEADAYDEDIWDSSGDAYGKGITFGNWNNYYPTYFIGDLDDVLIYDRALTADEIRQLGISYVGGGIKGNGCEATISKCVIEDCDADLSGGGIDNCDGVISHCIIRGNSAETGGGLANCDGTIENCVIDGNKSSQDGSGLYDCDADIVNCAIVGNKSTNGTVLYDCNGDASIENNIIWDDETILLTTCNNPNYSCIYDWAGGGTDNITDDPLFWQNGYWSDPDTWVAGNYHIRNYSECINKGNPSFDGTGKTDIDGEARVAETVVDMGVDEVADSAPPAPTSLTATSTESQISLNWVFNNQSVGDLHSFRVYRSTTAGGWYRYIGSTDENTKTFDDMNLVHDTVYYYVVTAVDDGGNESLYSNEASATAIDTTAPAAPGGLTASVEGNTVVLEWDGNTEIDLAGYNLYRSQSPPAKVNTLLITENSYTDTPPTAGTTSYTAQAVDNSGNLSLESEPPVTVDLQCTVTISSGFEGFIAEPGSGAFSYTPPTGDISIIANAYTGYNFDEWTGTAVYNLLVADPQDYDTELNIENGFEFAYTLKAKFAIEQYTLSLGTRPDGSITEPATLDNPYDYGTQIAIKATPDVGYHFVEWTGTAVDSGMVADPYDADTELTVTDAGTLSAIFAKSEYLLTSSSATGGSFTVDVGGDVTEGGRRNVEYGDVATITTTADDGYEFIGWAGTVVDDELIDETEIDDPVLTINDFNDSYTLEAQFQAKIFYVDALYGNDTDTDGRSWGEKFATLQKALDSASSAGGSWQIWVAGSEEDDVVHVPSVETVPGDPRSKTFQLVSNVAVYGGFEGSEEKLEERDLVFNEIILSGDIDKDTYPDNGWLPTGENAYHVVTAADNVVLDGFTIVGGVADKVDGSGGGGMLIDGNTGVTVRNCSFQCNNASDTHHGGGMFITGGNVTLINCLFAGNTAAKFIDGTGMAYGNGGALYITTNATVAVANCTISNNHAGEGAGIYNSNTGSLTIANTILWENIDSDETKDEEDQIYDGSSSCEVNYCCIQGLTGDLGGTGNIGDDPVFVKPGSWLGVGVPDSISITAKIRDFHGSNAVYPDGHPQARDPQQYAHKDFQKPIPDPSQTSGCDSGVVEEGIVGPYGATLVEEKPDYDENHLSCTTGSTDRFEKWYNDTEYSLSEEQVLCLHRKSDVTYEYVYEFEDTTYFPIDDKLLDADSDGRDVYLDNSQLKNYKDSSGNYHNFHFTTELHTTFDWDGTEEYFNIYGSDDDLFIYLNGYLVLDVGGIHAPRYRKMKILDDGTVWYSTPTEEEDDSDPQAWEPYEQIYMTTLTAGTYSFDLFFAERCTVQSNLKFSTSLKFASSFELGDYRLQSDSPCIDAADNTTVPSGVEIELDGYPRFVDDTTVNDTGVAGVPARPVVDMGAYEYLPANPLVVDAGKDKVITLPDDTVELSDATITGGYQRNLRIEWSEMSIPPGCDVDFDPDTAGVNEPDSFELHPTVKLIFDDHAPALFEKYDSVDFILRLGVNDDLSTAYDYVTITVYPGPDYQKAPVVDAGNYPDPVNVRTAITLTGEASDDGLPYNGTLYTRWSVEKFPVVGSVKGEVVFADETDPTTDATFSQPGEYALKLWASDGEKEAEDLATVNVNVGLANNPPTVNAGADRGPINPLTDSTSFQLNDATASDPDGLLHSLTYKWEAPVGPATGATFDDPQILNPMVTFTKPGIYVLQLTVDDGQFQPYDQLTVAVNKPANIFEVYADEDQRISLPDSAVLDGSINIDDTIHDDESTVGQPITIEWLQIEGPGTTQFSDPTSVDTMVEFSEPGIYVLEVKGIYGLLTDTDQIEITVKSGQKITGGEDHTLIIDKSGSVWACGPNSAGILGDNSTENRLLPVLVHAGGQDQGYNPVDPTYLADISSVAGGWTHSMALDKNKRVWSWGSSYYGQLGNHTVSTSMVPIQALSGMQDGDIYSTNPLENIIAIATGRSGEHSLAVDSDLNVWSWGINSGNGNTHGQLGHYYGGSIARQVLSGDQDGDPSSTTPLENIISVAGGAYHSMALEKLDPQDTNCNGRVYTFGSNTQGCLGLGVEPSIIKDSFVPCTVVGPDRDGDSSSDETVMQNVVAISAGWMHCMALEKLDPTDDNCNGRVYTWGTMIPGDGEGQGIYTIPRMVRSGKQDGIPTSNTPLENIVAIGAGEMFCLALESSGNVWSWGSNGSFWYRVSVPVLGDGTDESVRYTPVKVVAPDRDGDGLPDDLNHDKDHTNDYLGDDIPIIAVSAGYWHSLAMDEMGNIYSWGWGLGGRLGIGTEENKNTPQLISKLGYRVNNIRSDQWYITIQEAIDDAIDEDTIVAYPGIYAEDIVFGSQNIILKSSKPEDVNVVTSTIIKGDGSSDVVTFSDGNHSTITGFTITEGGIGVLCNSNSWPTVTNNIIHNNLKDGMQCHGTINPTIKNNIVYENGCNGCYWTGIRFKSTAGVALVRNNTIVSNNSYGIYFEGGGTQPEVRNCVIWGNIIENIRDNTLTDVLYCGVGGGYTGIGNHDINADIFVNIDSSYYYQLSPDGSNPCINGGGGTIGDYAGETDINGDPRVLGGQVDIGADEFSPYLIEAGSTKTITITESVDLSDAEIKYIYQTGTPSSNLTFLWSEQSKPPGAMVTYTDNAALDTTASFDTVGYYLLKLEAFEDGNLVGSDTVAITVHYNVEIDSSKSQLVLPDNQVILTANITGSGPAYDLVWIGSTRPEVVFDPSNSSPTACTFSEPGIYPLMVILTDITSGAIVGQDTITIPVNHQQILVEAGAEPAVVTLPDNRVYLNGTISGGVPAETLWQVGEDAVDLVTFDDSSSLQTWVEFDQPGEYGIGLVTKDVWGYTIGVDIITVTVNPPSYDHLVVDAGEDQEIVWPQDFVFMTGKITGDIPYDSVKWIDPSDGNITFEPDDDVLAVKATFTEAGEYHINLVVKNGSDVVGVDTVVVTVNFEQVIIDAGQDQNVTWKPNGVTVDLAGQVTTGDYDTVEWISPAPEKLTFTDDDQLGTQATITQAGKYGIGLIAKNASGDVLASDTLWITVDYQQVIVDAGEDQEINLSSGNSKVSLHGDIISGAPQGIKWVIPESWGAATGSLTSLDTWVEFPGPGIYTIGLAALDGNVTVGWDTVTITALPEGYDLTVDLVSNLYEVTLTGDPAQAGVTLTVTGTGSYSSLEWVFNEPEGLNLLDVTAQAEPNDAIATFYQPGTYDIGLQLKNSYGEVIGLDKVTIKVLPQIQEDVTITASVSDSEIELPTSGSVLIDLTGSVTGGDTYYVKWIDPTGLLDINSETSLTTYITFDSTDDPGIYTVSFVVRKDNATTGQIVGTIELTITVRPSGYSAVTVDAGADQEVTLPASGEITLPLLGTVTGDTGPYTYEWIDPSDQFVTFDPVDQLSTQATFTAPGEYHIGLIVKSGTAIVGADTVVINVHAYGNREIYVNAGSDQTITYSADPYVDLTGEIVGYFDKVEWSVSALAGSVVDITNVNGIDVKAAFAYPGTYTFMLKALLADGTCVGWDAVQVTVEYPKAIVKAKAGLTAGSAVEEYSAVYNVPVTLSLIGEVAGDTSALTYEWDILSDSTGTAIIADEDAQNTYINIDAAGKCQLVLYAKVLGQVISQDTIWIILMSGNPIAEAGEYPIVTPGVPLTLNKAKAWYMSGSTPTYDWVSDSATGVTFNPDPPNELDTQQVTFPSEGCYELTLTVHDSIYGDDTDTVNIVVEQSDGFVYAGAAKQGLQFYGIPMNDAKVVPSGLSYEWTVTAGAADEVEFSPSSSVLHPEVTFNAAGTYELTLTVNNGDPPYNEPGDPRTVSVTVVSHPVWDETDPPILTLTATNGKGGSDIDGTTLCSNEIYIALTAEDPHLAAAYVKLDGDKLIPDEVIINKGTKDDLQELTQIYRIDTHTLAYSASQRSLTAHAWDKAGNQVSPPLGKLFTTVCIIYDYVIPEVVTSSGQSLEFTADLAPGYDQEWTLKIYDPDDTPVYTSPAGNTDPVSISGTATSFNITADGVYKVELIAHATGDIGNELDKATGSFNVAINVNINQLEAEIDDDLHSHPDPYSIVPLDSRKTITEGLYELEGKAYHIDFPDEVQYRIDLSGEGIHRNVTPGTLDEYRFATGTVGDATTDGSFGILDFTTIPNGIYSIHLTVKCPGLTKYDEVEVALNCPLKLGNIKFSQEDITIPVGGVPLTVVRSYDSFRKDKQGEFGHGWTYSLAGLDIELYETRDRMSEFTRRRGSEIYRDVTLTLPNGKRATFLSTMEPFAWHVMWGMPNIVYQWEIKYISPDVNAELRTKNREIFNHDFLPFFEEVYDNYWWNYDDPDFGYYASQMNATVDLSLHDFSGYTLEMEDGTVYNIERAPYQPQEVDPHGLGFSYTYRPQGKPYLASIDLPTGESIEFDVDLSDKENPQVRFVDVYQRDSSVPAKSLQIDRNDDGLIEAIWAPGDFVNPSLKYEYDNYYNLTKVSKLVTEDDPATPAVDESEYEHIVYVYDDHVFDPADHYITSIKDPRGLSPIQYVYNDAGQLIATIDAKGNRIEISHDIVGRLETVTDRAGKVTIYEYNERGNVEYVRKHNDLGQVIQETTYEYHDDSYPDGASRVLVPLVASPTSDDDYSITTTDYDSQGRPRIVIDPENNVMTNSYDDNGNVTKSTQWRPLFDTAVFPENYPYTQPAEHEEVTTSRIFYSSDNLLIASCVTTGNEPGLAVHSMSLTYYEDITRRLEHTVQVNTDYFDGAGTIDDFFVADTNRTQLVAITSLSEQDKHIVTSYDYDVDGNPYSVSDPYVDGGTAVYRNFSHYNANGQQDYSWSEWDDPTDSDGLVNRYVYTYNVFDAAGRTIETYRVVEDESHTELSNVTLSQTWYNKIGRIDITINQTGQLTEYAYDETGNLVETLTFASQAVYEAGNDPLTISQTLYDAAGRVIVSVGPYDPLDTTVGYPVGSETIYDELGRVVETRRWASVAIDMVDLEVNGAVVGRTVNPNATPANAGDGTGGPIGWTAGGALPVADNELSYRRTEYDIAGRAKKSYSLREDGTTEVCTNEYIYDLAGKQIKVITLPGTADEAITETHYDGTRRDWVKDARNNTTNFEYDDLGRVIKTTYPATTQNPETYVHVGYNGLGRKEWQSEQTTQGSVGSLTSDEIKQFEYDTAGRLTAVILPPVPDPVNSDIMTHPRYEYKFDAYGNQIEIWDNIKQYTDSTPTDYSANRVTSFTHDEMGRQTSRTLPDSSSVEYKHYDDYGRLKVHIDFKEQATGYFYNSLGQLQYKCFYDQDNNVGDGVNDNYNPSDSGSGWTTRTEYTYDNLGRKDQITVDDVIAQDYDYDNESRVKQIDTVQGIVNYSYSPVTGRKTQVCTPADGSDTDIEYTYDALGRLYEVIVHKRNGQNTSETFTYGYNAVGSLDWVCYPNGNCADYEYDNLNRLAILNHEDNGGVKIVGYDYDVFADGQRQQVTESYNSGNTAVYTWTYDNLNRLTQEVYDDLTAGNVDHTHQYIYNLVGSRLNRNILVGSGNNIEYHYNTLDQLYEEHETVSGGADIYRSYFYDSNGSMRYKIYGTYVNNQSSIVDPHDEYQYNLQNRLASFIPNSGDTVAYGYNPDGVRVDKQIGSNNPVLYLIDPQNHTGYAQVFKETQTGSVDVVYILSHDVLAQAIGANNPDYLMYDGHGSVRHLANSGGSVTENYHYDGYGNLLSNSTPSPSTNLLYVGEMYDTSLDWYYNRARYYVPLLGIFNQFDPYFGNNQDPQSMHKYLYAHGNPLNAIDPTGTMSLGETMSVIYTRAITLNMQVGVYVQSVKPLIKGVMGFVVARDWYQGLHRFNGADASALTIGSNVTFPSIFNLGATAGADLVVGRNGHAWFGYGSVSTDYSLGTNLTNVGLVFNCPSSQKMEGRGRAITLSLGLIPPSARGWIQNSFQQCLPKLLAAFTQRSGKIGRFANKINPDLMSRFSNALTNALAKTFSPKSSITLWGGDEDTFGFSFAPGFSSFGGSERVTASHTVFYEQIHPEDDNGSDIDVRF